MSGIQQKISDILSSAFTTAVDSLVAGGGVEEAAASALEQPIDPLVQASQHADFQANAAMSLSKRLKLKPRDIADAVVSVLDTVDAIETAEVAGPGFINLTLASDYLGECLSSLQQDERLGVVSTAGKTIVVDYSAPNVAKEMHVGHLRSTIIGDACVRLMEWMGHTVLRRNHIGDWGTPFGMLIEHLTDIGEAQATEELSLGDLNTFYRAAREKFESSEEFQNRARQRVVALQSGDEETLRLWQLLINQSQSYFVSVYEKMDVRLDGSEFFGESSYNDLLQPTLDELKDKGLVEKNDGAECLFPQGFVNRDKQPLPLIVKKTDGGFGYAATDLAALRNRIADLKAERLLYVVGTPQQQHLEMVYEAGRMAGWLESPVTAEHINFGSVLGADGKMFKSRSGDTIKLASLLQEAVDRSTAVIEEKNPDLDQQQRQEVAESVGIGAIKYADLSTERTRDYVFDFDQMLALEGNTAPYLQYANARIQSILRQAQSNQAQSNQGQAKEQGSIKVAHVAEQELAILLLKFPDVIAEVAESLLFHRLAGYLFSVATAYSKFYSQCPVLKAGDESTRQSRLALCELTSRVLSTGLSLLGIRSPNRM